MTPTALLQSGFDFQTLQDLLYGEVDGYSIASTGRDRTGNYSEDFTYGEITPQVAWDMLNSVHAKEGETFYDLGAGTGKGVMYAASLFPFGRCAGIELIDELHDASQDVLWKYITEVQPYLDDAHQWQDVQFILGSMLEEDFSDADIIYTHCTCFCPELMEGITRKFEQLKPGSRIITISKEIESPELVPFGNEMVEMGWGSATAYYYERK